jgi:hypothetical protein
MATLTELKKTWCVVCEGRILKDKATKSNALELVKDLHTTEVAGKKIREGFYVYCGEGSTVKFYVMNYQEAIREGLMK